MSEYATATDDACRCTENQEWYAAQKMTWALAYRSQPYRETTRENVVTAAVACLADEFGARTFGIVRNVHFAVEVSREEFSTSVQCDDVEDGFTHTLYLWVARFPDRARDRPPYPHELFDDREA